MRVMRVMKGKRGSRVVSIGVVALAAAKTLIAGSIYIPNHSFESPVVPYVFPYVSLIIGDWQREPAPAYWTQLGYTVGDWNQCSGTFINTPFDGQGNPAPLIDNLDGNQAAFMFPWPGQGLWQTLSAEYKVGMSYHLTVGIQGGGTMLLDVPMEIRLFYEDAGGNRLTVGAMEILNTNPPNTKVTHLPEYTLIVPEVAATDAWAGRPIGVEIISTAGMEVFQTFGYQQWEFDNVRLTEVPEPASALLLTAGLWAVLARKRRSLG